MRVYSAKQSKNEICQIFRIDFQFIISGIEREREKTEYLWRRRRNYPELGMREDNRRKRERERKEREMVRQRNPQGVGPSPPNHCPMLLKTGFHADVFTYAPRSSLRPCPGPQFWSLISRASLTLRS